MARSAHQRKGLLNPSSGTEAAVIQHPATRDYYTDAGSVQVLYRPVVAAYSEDGKGIRLDRSRLPAFPPEDEIVSKSSFEGAFWAEQMRRCKFGWTEPVTGRWLNPVFYFYLNFVTIPLENGRIEAPMWSDSDQEVFDWIYFLMIIGPGKQAEDGIITKGRRKHWTFNTHCGFFLYYFVFGTRGDLGIAYDVAKTREQGQRLFERAYDMLPSCFQHASLERSKDGEITAGTVREDFDFKTQKVSIKFSKSHTIVFRETDKTPGVFRSMNLGLALIDEAGKYKKLKKVITATTDCLKLGTRKHGTMLIGGTSDAIDNKTKDYHKQWDIAGKLRGWRRWFIAAWKINPDYWDPFTGISNRQGSERAYYQNRQEKLAAKDTEGYYTEIQENPLYPSECFHSATLSNYSAQKLSDPAQRISTAAPGDQPIRGHFEYSMNINGEVMGAYFEADGDYALSPGDWLLHPSSLDAALPAAMPHLHTGAVDDVYKDADEIVDSDSLCAMTMYRRQCFKEGVRSNLFVGSYLARPSRAMFAREVHKAQLYFRAKMLIENNDVFLKNFLLAKNLQDDLIYINGQVGIRNSSESLAQQEYEAQTWMDEHGLEDLWFTDILNGFKLWRQGNTDSGSAAHMNLLAVTILKDLPVKTGLTDAPVGPTNILGRSAMSGERDLSEGTLRQQSAIRRGGVASPLRPSSGGGLLRRAS